jgi:hypothetical protein
MAHEFKTGDFAQSIETGWIGQIQSLEVQTIGIDDDRSFQQTMATMFGVDFWRNSALGIPKSECVDSGEVRWFSVDDLRPVHSR